MGDRAVIGFKNTEYEDAIYIYSHWGGASRYDDTRRAIDAARPRWDDPAYATRIAISTIVGENWNRETGYGLSVGKRSWGRPDYDEIIVVVWSRQVVQIWDIDEALIILELPFENFRVVDPLGDDLEKV